MLQINNYPHIKSFAPSRGALKDWQKDVLNDLYPVYGISLEDISSWSLFYENSYKVIEIGCGMGEATLELAERFSHIQYLALDVYKPGIARILREIQRLDLKNLKVAIADAILVLDQLEENSIDGFHIFFPDPWPKERHHKRRLMRSQVIEKLFKALKKNGFLYFISDWEPYSQSVSELLETSGLFENVYKDLSSFPTEARPCTRFEKKGLAKGHLIKELYFQKV